MRATVPGADLTLELRGPEPPQRRGGVSSRTEGPSGTFFAPGRTATTPWFLGGRDRSIGGLPVVPAYGSPPGSSASTPPRPARSAYALPGRASTIIVHAGRRMALLAAGEHRTATAQPIKAGAIPGAGTLASHGTHSGPRSCIQATTSTKDGLVRRLDPAWASTAKQAEPDHLLLHEQLPRQFHQLQQRHLGDLQGLPAGACLRPSTFAATDLQRTGGSCWGTNDPHLPQHEDSDAVLEGGGHRRRRPAAATRHRLLLAQTGTSARRSRLRVRRFRHVAGPPGPARGTDQPRLVGTAPYEPLDAAGGANQLSRPRPGLQLWTPRLIPATKALSGDSGTARPLEPRSAGRPSARSPRMLRWISSVPPTIDMRGTDGESSGTRPPVERSARRRTCRGRRGGQGRASRIARHSRIAASLPVGLGRPAAPVEPATSASGGSAGQPPGACDARSRGGAKRSSWSRAAGGSGAGNRVTWPRPRRQEPPGRRERARPGRAEVEGAQAAGLRERRRPGTPLEGQRGQRHRPTPVDLADQVGIGHPRVVEEHLVELGVAGHLPQRPHLDAGLASRSAKSVMPRCFGTSGSVRARSMARVGVWPPEVQTFCPLTIHSSPSRSARVCRPARSEPAPGSENSWHQIRSLAIAGR